MHFIYGAPLKTAFIHLSPPAPLERRTRVAILRYTREEIAGTVEHSVKSRRAERRKRQNFCSTVIPTDVHSSSSFSPFSSFSCFCTGCFALSAQPPLVEEFRIFTGFVVQRRLISVRRIQKPLFRGGEQQPPPLFGHVPRFKVAFPSSERLFIRLKINPLPSFSLSLSLFLTLSVSVSLWVEIQFSRFTIVLLGDVGYKNFFFRGWIGLSEFLRWNREVNRIQRCKLFIFVTWIERLIDSWLGGWIIDNCYLLIEILLRFLWQSYIFY